ncbi:MAG: peptide chain release factor 1 [Candidatus Nealsonbacteria bacterium]|jgi:peptide chain release factor 1|nr:peptide chain release factor 1 [Candidatus Nealsonbacteria bacterium]
MVDIEAIKKEYEKILSQLSDPELISNWPAFEELTKRKSFLEKIIEKEKEIEDLKNRIEENKEILKSHEDKELSSLAETEIVQLSKKLKILEEELENLFKLGVEEEKRKDGPQSVIVEIRAGTGGEEAALFAADLFRTYSKYSQIKGWKQKILDSRPSEIGGFKEIVFEIKDGDVWSSMKYEAGVHRVQRIPTTEKSGRVHTSTASVAVLQKPKKGKIAMNPKDLKIDTYKASGPGGQYVNKRMTAVRITHLPTGTIVTSQTERSLQQNKENALSIMEAKILEKKIKEEEEKLKDKRKTQIGKAERAEKIRTYNFPQNRITDHRIKKSFHNLEEIMEGKLDAIISILQESKY